MRSWRQRADSRLRYYLYVSDAKLDMLFEQIDRSTLKRISAEVRVDLTLASVTLTRADDPDPARHTVVLAGSGRHVLGRDGVEETTRSHSSFPDHILRALDEHIYRTPELADSIREAKDRDQRWWPENRSIDDLRHALNESFFSLGRRGSSRAQTLEFLAVPLVQDKGPAHTCPGLDDAHTTILGTPLYVAVASGPAATETSAPG